MFFYCWNTSFNLFFSFLTGIPKYTPHSSILFVTKNSAVEATFYLDPSKTNIVWMVQQTLESKFKLVIFTINSVDFFPSLLLSLEDI